MTSMTPKTFSRFALATLCAGFLAASPAHAALPIQHWTQANGANVYLVEARAFPWSTCRWTSTAAAGI